MKNKEIEIDKREKVHYSIKGRKRFKAKIWCFFFLMLIILAGCSVMIMFGGWTWDPDQGFKPTEEIKHAYQYALIWGGAILALATLVGFVLICIKQFKVFYSTQEKYFKTKEYQARRKKVLSNELHMYKKSTLKWYKKMGYISSSEVKSALATKKQLKKNKNNKD